MKVIFLLMIAIMLTGCITKTVYVDRTVYVYPDEQTLVSNGTVKLIDPQKFKTMNVDEKLTYSNGLIKEYENLYSMCMVDKRTIQTWITETKTRHQESSTGQKQ